MNDGTVGFFLYVFAMSLPVSISCWVLTFLGLGLFRDEVDQTRLFSIVIRFGMAQSNFDRLVLGIGGLLFFNGILVWFAVKAGWGVPTAVIGVYFLIQALSLAAIVGDLRLKARRSGR